MSQKRRFEEEVKDQTSETTNPEEGSEETSTPDTHEQFVNILVEMGLSADQAEAVHQMAMDLVNAGQEPAQDAQPTEMRRMSRRTPRRNFSRRPARRASEQREARVGRSKFSRRPTRSRQELSEAREKRTQVMLRRQRNRIQELESQLREMGQQPAAAPVSRAPQNFSRTTVNENFATPGTPRDRVFKKLQHLL